MGEQVNYKDVPPLQPILLGDGLRFCDGSMEIVPPSTPAVSWSGNPGLYNYPDVLVDQPAGIKMRRIKPIKSATYVTCEVLDAATGAAIVNKATQALNDGALRLTFPLTSFNSGSDPEIFAVDEKGAVIPAWTFLQGKDPAIVPFGGGQYDYSTYPPTRHSNSSRPFWDGFQAEFTVDPTTCMGAGIDYIRLGLKAVYDAARIVNPKAKLSPLSTLPVSPKVLMSAKLEHVRFGCEPSKNLYNTAPVPAPDARELYYRFAGSHKHFGIGKHTPDDEIANIVRGLDRIAGVALVSLCASFANPIRREFYGRAGEYRLPKHGLEWRTPGSEDLCHPVITHLAWDLSRIGLHMGLTKTFTLWETTDEETVEVINNTDVAGARKILARNKGLLLALMKGAYGSNSGRAYVSGAVRNIYQLDASDKAVHVILNGLESIIKDPLDMVGNWKLDQKWESHCDSDRLTFVAFASSNELITAPVVEPPTVVTIEAAAPVAPKPRVRKPRKKKVIV